MGRGTGPNPPALNPPIKPMLARIAPSLPEGDYLFEPKWDGFRALVFRQSRNVLIQSRDLRPLDRYFPELHEALLDKVPAGSVLDGEIVIATAHGLDFDALQLRLHPAASRVARLAAETPASFVAFDLLAARGRSILASPQVTRRAALERLLRGAKPPLFVTVGTRDRSQAADWLERFEGAGLDGVVAKPVDAPYQPGVRAMLKIKHVRTANCVVAGFRWHKTGQGAVGSLLLGLYDTRGVLQHVGVTSSFTMAERRNMAKELEPLRKNALVRHPWLEWGGAKARGAPAGNADDQRMPGAPSRWNGGKDLSWEPLQPRRVCEVKYDHLQGRRFRHAAVFLRWRSDKPPRDCTYDQLETVQPYELKKVLNGARGSEPCAPG